MIDYQKKTMLRDPENFDYETIKLEIESITSTKIKQIVCLLYASGARVSELIKIKKTDINLQMINKKQYLIIRHEVLKKRGKTQYVQAPVSLQEQWLIEPIQSLVKNSPTDTLVPLHRATVYRKVLKATGINPHGFRKLRATHLSKYHGFREAQLVKFFGWQDFRPASVYVKANLEDIAY